jgi:hypothetical protein
LETGIVTIQTFDRYGNRTPEVESVTLHGLVSGREFQGAVALSDVGVFTGRYTPLAYGTCHLSVKVNDVHIRRIVQQPSSPRMTDMTLGVPVTMWMCCSASEYEHVVVRSPFAVPIAGPHAPSCIAVGDGLHTANSLLAAEFVVSTFTSDNRAVRCADPETDFAVTLSQGRCEIRGSLQAWDTLEASVDNNRNRYKFQYVVPSGGVWTMHIQLSGREIQQSPFFINVDLSADTASRGSVGSLSFVSDVALSDTAVSNAEVSGTVVSGTVVSDAVVSDAVVSDAVVLNETSSITSNSDTTVSNAVVLNGLSPSAVLDLCAGRGVSAAGPGESNTIATHTPKLNGQDGPVRGRLITSTLASESAAVSALHCRAYGAGLHEGLALQIAHFTLQLFDHFLNPIEHGGASVEVNCVGPASVQQSSIANLFGCFAGRSTETISADVVDLENGKYGVAYTPQYDGQYAIDIKVNGDTIGGCPFLADISGPAPEFCKAQGDGLHVVVAGELATFQVAIQTRRGIAVGLPNPEVLSSQIVRVRFLEARQCSPACVQVLHVGIG